MTDPSHNSTTTNPAAELNTSVLDTRPSSHVWKVAAIAAACVIAFSLRLVQLPMGNFGGMLALSLFCGSLSRHRAAVLIPLAVRILSDLAIQYKTGYGFFPSWPFDYTAYVLIFALGTVIRPDQALRIAGGTVASIAIYFVISNLGVWWIWPDTYEHTAAGLLNCYVNAIPFAKGTLFGNAVLAIAFFGSWNMLTSKLPALGARPAITRS